MTSNFQSGDIVGGVEYYGRGFESFSSPDCLIQKTFLQLQLAKLDQNNPELLSASKQSCNHLIELLPTLPVGFVIRAQIELAEEDINAAVKSVRTASTLSPENLFLKKFLEILEQRTEDKLGDETIFGQKIELDEALKRLNCDPRASEYSSDPAFMSNLEKLLSDDFDIFSIEQDERLRHVCDILSGGHFFKNHISEATNDETDSIISDDEQEDVEQPPQPSLIEQNEQQLEALEMKSLGNEAFVAKNLNQGEYDSFNQ